MINWEHTTLGDLFEIGAGKSVTPQSKIGISPFPFLRTSNVFWRKIDLSNLDEMDFNQEEQKTKCLKKGDLLVCEGGDIGRSAIWEGQLEKCSFQNHLHRLRPKTQDVSPYFYMFYLQAGFTQFGIYQGVGNKTTIPNLSRSRLKALAVPKVALNEQIKVAAILHKIQKAIEVEDKLIQITRELKKSTMKQLFTNGLRGEKLKETEIGSVPESWEIQHCDSICEMITVGVVVKPASYYVHNGIPAFRSLNVLEDRINHNNLVYFSKNDNETNLSKSKLKAGDVLIVRTGYPGTSCVVPKKYDGANCIDIVIARPKIKIVKSEFLSRFLNSESGKQQALSSSRGLAQQHMNVSAVKTVNVPIPSLTEQAEITHILQAIDQKIEIHEKKGATLQDLFKTMLHKLMTAEIRVHDLDIDTSDVV